MITRKQKTWILGLLIGISLGVWGGVALAQDMGSHVCCPANTNLNDPNDPKCWIVDTPLDCPDNMGDAAQTVVKHICDSGHYN